MALLSHSQPLAEMPKSDVYKRQPTTGEINYKNIFKHIYSKGFDGVLCCEHGKSISGKDGEKAFIKAYREVDSFEV